MATSEEQGEKQGVQSKTSPLRMRQALYPTDGVDRPPRPALLPAAWTYPSLPSKAGAVSSLLPIRPQGPQESLVQISCLGFHLFLFLEEAQEPWLATFLSLNWSCQNNTLDYHVSENLLQNIKIYTPTQQMCIFLYLSHIFHETHMVYYYITNI